MKRNALLIILPLAGGIFLGAWLFSDTQPRAFLEAPSCRENCLSAEQVLGLLGSVGIQKFPDFIPSVVKETDKTIAMRHPFPNADIHYVIIPKKDIKSVEDISQEDTEYIIDAYALMGTLIQKQNLRDYKIVINGPGFQTVQYLHFQLVSELPE